MTETRKPHPGRKRRVAGLALLTSAAGAAVLWIVSYWWFGWTILGRTYLDGGSGVYCVSLMSREGIGYLEQVTFNEPAVYRRESKNPWQWWRWSCTPSYKGSPVEHLMLAEVQFPGWLPVAALGAGGGLFLHSGILARRRSRIGHCPHCGYDKRGLASDALCPECGE